jgi:hypothetical protein
MLEPPNRINPVTGAPAWYESDEDAWADFQAAQRVAAR